MDSTYLYIIQWNEKQDSFFEVLQKDIVIERSFDLTPS